VWLGKSFIKQSQINFLINFKLKLKFAFLVSSDTKLISLLKKVPRTAITFDIFKLETSNLVTNIHLK